MFKLTEEQQVALGRAVAAAPVDVLRRELDDLYARFAEAVAERRPRCDASGRCCRFEAFGHRLFVTTAELAVFVARAVATRDDFDGVGCAYQVAGRCSVHGVRPFGCRVFFCDPTVDAWTHEMYERYHAEIVALHERFGVSYFYVEWRDALGSILPASSLAGPQEKQVKSVKLAVLRI